LTTNRAKLRQSALLRASTNTIRIVSVHQRKRFVLARSTLLLPFCAARRGAARLVWTPLKRHQVKVIVVNGIYRRATYGQVQGDNEGLELCRQVYAYVTSGLGLISTA
jgi:hypothetical protein